MPVHGRGGQIGVRSETRRARILLLIEDKELEKLTALTLRHLPHDVKSAPTRIAEARKAIEESKPHLIILDIDADDGRALKLISESEADGRTPIIALIKRSDLTRQLDAFNRGADDCLGVPFVPPDLVARVLAVLRRAYGQTATGFRPLRFGGLEIDLANREVRTNGKDLHLTSLEQALLYLLAANAGSVMSRDAILDAIWGSDFLADSNVVDRHVRALRVKLHNDWRKPTYIETVPGAGYRFVTGDAGPG